MKDDLPVKKIAGAFSVLLFLCLSLAPDVFHIPVVARPWIFIFTVVWIVTLASGVFSP